MVMKRSDQSPGKPEPRYAFALAIIFGPAFVYLLETIIFILFPFKLPIAFISVAYPNAYMLVDYCSTTPCLYDPLRVSSLYSLQFITLLALSAILVVSVLKSTRKDARLGHKMMWFSAIVIMGAAIDYYAGDFSFHSNTFFPNRVTESSTGLFRYVFVFWAVGLAVVFLGLIAKANGGARGSR